MCTKLADFHTQSNNASFAPYQLATAEPEFLLRKWQSRDTFGGTTASDIRIYLVPRNGDLEIGIAPPSSGAKAEWKRLARHANFLALVVRVGRTAGAKLCRCSGHPAYTFSGTVLLYNLYREALTLLVQ